MAVRTTIADVTLIMASVPADGVVTKFIDSANLTVTEILGSDTTLTDAMKADIECWLTAHLIACTLKRMPAKAGAGPADVTFMGKSDMGLETTPYGQMVLVMDTTGKMRSQVSGKKVSIVAVTSFED